MFSHILKSWFITLLVYPVMLILSIMLISGSLITDPFGYYIIMLLIIISLVGSFFVILLLWLFLNIIIHSETTVVIKFILWLAAIAVAILLTSVVIILIMDDGFFTGADLMFAVPATISVWIVECIRFRHFKQINIEINHPLQNLQLNKQ